MRRAAFASGGAAVNSGGIAVSSAQVTQISRLVHEVWQSSGGSRTLFEDHLRRRLGAINGGRKFLTALSLACGVQMAMIPDARAFFTPEVGSGVTVIGETVTPGNSQVILSGGAANSTYLAGAEGDKGIFAVQLVSG